MNRRHGPQMSRTMTRQPLPRPFARHAAKNGRNSAHLIEIRSLYEDGTNYFRVNMGSRWFLETE